MTPSDTFHKSMEEIAIERLLFIHRKIDFVSTQGCEMVCASCMTFFPCEQRTDLEFIAKKIRQSVPAPEPADD